MSNLLQFKLFLSHVPARSVVNKQKVTEKANYNAIIIA